MPAGKYRHRIRVEAPTRVENADGQMVNGWPALSDKPFAELWAHVALAGSDQTFDQQQRTETRWTVTLRSSAKSRQITSKMRMRFRGHVLEISAVDDVDFEQWEVQIPCVEQKAAGR